MKTKTALLLIDVQKGFCSSCWGKRNNLLAEKNISTLLTLFRSVAHPIFHIQHLSTSSESPLHAGQMGVEFMECAQPMDGESIF